MIGHRLVGTALLLTGDIATSREHLDCAIALYNPGEHRPLATRFGYDLRVLSLTYRSWALWLLGYPEAALVDTDYTLKEARDIGHAVTLMIALAHIGLTHIFCGNYAAATAQFDELVALGDKNAAIF
jgi:tetratricopeptide (TPR) repeat protein